MKLRKAVNKSLPAWLQAAIDLDPRLTAPWHGSSPTVALPVRVHQVCRSGLLRTHTQQEFSLAFRLIMR
ncbi:hypothetical protein ACFQ2B_14415 [Streptomyces stramineus]|uniref:hypothetical protein n=1 Tax=Streptomyces TaxID=1883 RepID=UPI0031E3885D